MEREFVRTLEFEKCWKDFGLTEDDIVSLEIHLCSHPQSGETIIGTGGLRKLRWALPNQGKRGSIRIVYVDFVYNEKLYLISAYAKNKQTDLTSQQRIEIKKFINELKNELKRK